MFLDANGEFLVVFGKVEPFLGQLRNMFQNPDYAANLEKLVHSVPDYRKRIDTIIARIREMIAQRTATAKA